MTDLLPTSARKGPGLTSRMGGASNFPKFMRRILKYPAMDFEYAFTQMVYLCVNPAKVYQFTARRKQTKDRWARDDPAFIVVQTTMLLSCAAAYGLAFGLSSAVSWLWLLFDALLQYFGVGLVMATGGWFLANKYLRIHHAHSVEQAVEWLYAFDIHCNAFFPFFLVLYVLHFVFLPALLSQSFMAVLFSNLLCGVGCCVYYYIMFLGYAALPFLEHPNFFLYPLVGLGILLIVSTAIGVSVPVLVLEWCIVF